MRHLQAHVTICILLAATALPAVAVAAVPATLEVQGALSSAAGAPVVDGLYGLTFALYDVQTGGAAVWAEPEVPVNVAAGRFRHVLGKAKPVHAALAAVKTAWLGVKVAGQLELPRLPLHSVAYALQAAAADKLGCTGCVEAGHLASGAISADKVGFTFAGSKTKGGPAIQALDLQCTGCVAMAEIDFNADLDIGGNVLKAKVVSAGSVNATQVSASSFVGDGSKLTGLTLPKGKCGAGEAVTGIAADGSLQCAQVLADAKGLPNDAIVQVSNGLLSNVFLHEITSPTTPVPITDNDPIGVADLIDFPDVGIAKSLSVKVKVANSNIGALTVQLYDPAKALIVLHDNSGKGDTLEGIWPAPNKPVSGDLSGWVGKNPKGIWRIKALDGAASGQKLDGAIVAWSVVVETISNKQISATGQLLAEGGFRFTRATKDLVVCDAGSQGFAYFHTPTKALRICNGSQFVPVNLDNLGTANNPAVDCKDLLKKVAGTVTGMYWIDPDGQGGQSPLPAYCDMDSGGGGWTLLLTLTHPRDQYGGSVHPLATNLNVGSPDPAKAYSRDWRPLIKPVKNSEFLIKHGGTGQWVRFVVNSFCGFDSTATAPCTGCHGTYASGCVFDWTGKQLSCTDTWLNSCSNCGGCLAQGCDTIGFNIGHGDYAAQYNGTQLFGAGWNSSNCEGAWGTAKNQAAVFPLTLWYR